MHSLLALTLSAVLAAEPAVSPPEELGPTDHLGWTIGGGVAGATAFATAGLMGGILLEHGNLSGDKGTGVLLGSGLSALSGVFFGSLIGWWGRDHSGGRGGVAALVLHTVAHLLLCGMIFAIYSFTPGGSSGTR
jgi:hypothetical protein